MSVLWGETSRADYDARLAAKGHKRAPAEQCALFFTATPERERKAAPAPAQLPGQVDLFAALAEEGDGDGQGEEDAEPEPAVTVAEAQRWEAFLPAGVALAEATAEQVRQAVHDGRAYGDGRRAQGFLTERHWDAFLAYVDHQHGCGECGQPGKAVWLEGSASWQPTSRICPEGRRLQRISDAGGCGECADVQERAGHWLTKEQLLDLHSVDHACPCCGGTEVVVTGTTGHGTTQCECRACPGVFTVSRDVIGPKVLRYLSTGHRAQR